MFAIFKREFLSYFRTPVGWVAICLLGVISGYYFSGMLTTDYAYVNINMEVAYLRTFFIILIPIITMRLFAEEKKNGTDVLLYTMPFSMKNAVIGKFLAAMALQMLMLLCLFSHMIITVILSGYISTATWGAIVGYLVLAALFISIGMLTSAMTENQIMSAVVCFVVLLFLSMLSEIATSISEVFKAFLKFTHFFGMSDSSIYSAGEGLREAIAWFDPYTRTSCYTTGVFKIVPLIFCLSFTAMFIYITYRVLEKKRWSQG
ncbi:MAG: ABC transporter permease subunit [Clostridiales bacterium]|nr:ABC transporter permease subunit [Clostridiales bacterium]